MAPMAAVANAVATVASMAPYGGRALAAARGAKSCPAAFENLTCHSLSRYSLRCVVCL